VSADDGEKVSRFLCRFGVRGELRHARAVHKATCYVIDREGNSRFGAFGDCGELGIRENHTCWTLEAFGVGMEAIGVAWIYGDLMWWKRERIVGDSSGDVNGFNLLNLLHNHSS
jgi:hypothetical protein